MAVGRAPLACRNCEDDLAFLRTRNPITIVAKKYAPMMKNASALGGVEAKSLDDCR